jgi:hypothetical protein
MPGPGPHLDAGEGEVGRGAGAVDVDEGGGEEDAHVAGRGGDDLVIVAAVDAGEVARLEGHHARRPDVVLHLQRRHVVARPIAAVASRVDGGDSSLDLHADDLARLGRLARRRGGRR